MVACLRAATWVVGTAMMRREQAACRSRRALGVLVCQGTHTPLSSTAAVFHPPILPLHARQVEDSVLLGSAAQIPEVAMQHMIRFVGAMHGYPKVWASKEAVMQAHLHNNMDAPPSRPLKLIQQHSRPQ